MNEEEKTFDLKERTAKFGEQILMFAKKTRDDNINRSLIFQLIRSGTSVGAKLYGGWWGRIKEGFYV